MLNNLPAIIISAVLAILLACSSQANSPATHAPEIVIIGSVTTGIEFWKARNFWGAEEHEHDLMVPRAITVVINKNWKLGANQLPVADKKELFYRALLPLVLYANELVLDERRNLQTIASKQSGGQAH